MWRGGGDLGERACQIGGVHRRKVEGAYPGGVHERASAGQRNEARVARRVAAGACPLADLAHRAVDPRQAPGEGRLPDAGFAGQGGDAGPDQLRQLAHERGVA